MARGWNSVWAARLKLLSGLPGGTHRSSLKKKWVLAHSLGVARDAAVNWLYSCSGVRPPDKANNNRLPPQASYETRGVGPG
jgi:hypothetical protein